VIEFLCERYVLLRSIAHCILFTFYDQMNDDDDDDGGCGDNHLISIAPFTELQRR